MCVCTYIHWSYKLQAHILNLFLHLIWPAHWPSNQRKANCPLPSKILMDLICFHTLHSCFSLSAADLEHNRLKGLWWWWNDTTGKACVAVFRPSLWPWLQVYGCSLSSLKSSLQINVYILISRGLKNVWSQLGSRSKKGWKPLVEAIMCYMHAVLKMYSDADFLCYESDSLLLLFTS